MSGKYRCKFCHFSSVLTFSATNFVKDLFMRYLKKEKFSFKIYAEDVLSVSTILIKVTFTSGNHKASIKKTFPPK